MCSSSLRRTRFSLSEQRDRFPVSPPQPPLPPPAPIPGDSSDVTGSAPDLSANRRTTGDPFDVITPRPDVAVTSPRTCLRWHRVVLASASSRRKEILGFAVRDMSAGFHVSDTWSPRD